MDFNMLKHHTVLSILFHLLLDSDLVLTADRINTLFNVSFISSTVNSALICQSHTAPSEIVCSVLCHGLCNTYSFYFTLEAVENCHCNSEDDQNVVFSDTKTDIKYEYLMQYPKDCQDVYKKGCIEDGIYYINPAGALGARVVTWCDMQNGGWTVIQHRRDGTEDFYRPWNDYVNGFGNSTGEYWFGLENIYQLTKDGSKLRIELDTVGDVTPTNLWAEYAFSLGSAATSYALNVSGYSGSCGDDLSFSNGMEFSTLDKDNNRCWYSCAETYQGAWWFNCCYYIHLNSRQIGVNGSHEHLFQCCAQDCYVKTSVMKVKRIQV